MDHPGKEYKVTYKIYYNKRLKKSFFHTKRMYPLYIQVIFDRTPITFKSYYYDLFSKSKYAIRVAGQPFTPDIKQIISKEKKLLDFIIDNNLQSFSLGLFKQEYAFYCRDLLDIMEGYFLNYLYTFFHDEGLPFLAETFQVGASVSVLYRLVQDMKKALDPRLYNKFIDNSFYYAPPYLPLYEFTEKSKSNPPVSLTVLEWMQSESKEKFAAFFKKQYQGYDIKEAFGKIQQFITHAGN